MVNLYHFIALFRLIKKQSIVEGQLPDWDAVIPAFNEEENILGSLNSVLSQTHPPRKVIILDDCSRDGTPAVVRESLLNSGANIEGEYSVSDAQQTRRITAYRLPSDIKVLYVRNERNAGKTANINWAAFNLVSSEFFINVDGDTVLERNYAERVLRRMAGDPNVCAGYGCPMPRRPSDSFEAKIVWATKLVAYRIHHYVFKSSQDLIGFVYNLMGCAVIYRTSAFREVPRPNDSYAGDTSHAWELQARGFFVRVVPDAFAYTTEPRSLKGFFRQRIRWGAGPFQNIYLRGWRTLRGVRGLRKLSTLWSMFYYTCLSTWYATLMLALPALCLLGFIAPFTFMKTLLLDLLSYVIVYMGSSAVYHKIRQDSFSAKGDIIPFIIFYALTRYMWFLTTLIALISTIVDIARGKTHEWLGMH